MQWLKKSLFLKLVLLIVLSTGLIFIIITIVNDYNLRNRMLEQQKKYYTSLAAQSALKIDTMLLKARMVVDKAVIEFKSKPVTRDESIELLQKILKSNSMIGGSAVALAPDCEVEKTGFRMLYSWKKDGDIKNADRISPEQDYKSEWFKKPSQQKREIWTNPYLDTDINKMMVTYSAPVIVTNKVTAIITCDLILDNVDMLLDSLELGHKGKPVLVTGNGRIISYARKDWIQKRLTEIAESLNNAVDRAIVLKISKMITQHKSGVLRVKQLNQNSMAWLYFDSVPQTGWRIGFVIPEETILAPIRQLNLKMLFSAIFGIMALLIPAFFVSHSITRPLQAICKASDKLATGDFDVPLPQINRIDEVGRLVEDFDQMRKKLRDYINTLAATTAEKEKIASELSIAREIQHGILPKLFPPFPEHAGLDIFAMLDSAREVGGDLYDFAIFDKNKLYICIGDVSGKGVPASLFMAIGKTLLKSTILSLKDPAETLNHVNNELAENNDSCMFITLFCGIVDLKTNKLVFANAGHNPPIIIHDKDVSFIKMASAPPLGVMPDISFVNEHIQLNADDKFLMYTDGVTEAMNGSRELFGEERLMNLLKSITCKTAEKYIYSIRKAIKSFIGNTEQSDDITMLCFSNSQDLKMSSDVSSPTATIVFANHKSEFKRLASWLEDISRSLGWSESFHMQFNLALEEWLVNVVTYAFPDNEINEIEVRLWQNDGKVSVQIIDAGIPFDPTKYQPADITGNIDERKIGGLGIHFIRNTLDVFSYERKDNHNIVLMQKALPLSSA